MGLDAVLRAFGLGAHGSQTQPDVSGSTIANLMFEMGTNHDLLVAALGSLYEEVKQSEPRPDVLRLGLWRDGQPFSIMLCDTTLPAKTCSFTYGDDEDRVNAFLQQVSGWADMHIGPFAETTSQDGTQVFVARGRNVHLELSRSVVGDNAEAHVRMVFDPTD